MPENSNLPALRRQALGTFIDSVREKEDGYREALPAHCQWDRVFSEMQMYLKCGSRNANELLEKCDPAQIAREFYVGCRLGLSFHPTLHQAYIVPFWNKDLQCKVPQFMPGYGGYLELMRRTGEIASCAAHVAYENDIFEVELGLNTQLTHKMNIRGERGNPIAAYFYAKMADDRADPVIEVLTWEECMRIRDNSPSAFHKSGPWWSDNPSDVIQMARKCPIRRASKYMSLSAELAEVTRLDDLDRTQMERILSASVAQPRSPGIESTSGGGLPAPSQRETIDVRPEQAKETVPAQESSREQPSARAKAAADAATGGSGPKEEPKAEGKPKTSKKKNKQKPAEGKPAEEAKGDSAKKDKPKEDKPKQEEIETAPPEDEGGPEEPADEGDEKEENEFFNRCLAIVQERGRDENWLNDQIDMSTEAKEHGDEIEDWPIVAQAAFQERLKAIKPKEDSKGGGKKGGDF